MRTSPDEGTVEHDRMHDELADKYQIYGCLMREMRFNIVECLSGVRPFEQCEPEENRRVQEAF